MEIKRIDEYASDELLVLDNQQIASVIDLECAFEGVPLLPPCPSEPEEPKFEPDATIYEVAGYKVKTPEEASLIMETLTKCQLWDTNSKGSYPNYINVLSPLSDYNKPKIETKQVYTPETYDVIRTDHEAYSAAKTRYDEAKKLYDNAYKEREDIAKDVWARVNEAHDEAGHVQFLKNEFNRYLELAQNNKQIAMNFLKKAHEVPEVLEKELCPEVDAVAS